jgi:TonB C terminal
MDQVKRYPDYATALLLISTVAHANDSRCTTPPYGDTPDNYETVIASDKKVTAKFGDAVGAASKYISDQALIEACKVKFEHAGRDDFHKHGITDADIAVTSPVGLAAQYMNFTSFQHEQQSHQNNYRAISVRDFVIDGPSLAASHAKVKMNGSYILQGVPTLYADSNAVISAKYYRGGPTQPHVALLTDDASHQLREALVSCDSDPARGQTGCQIEIRGEATMCGVTNAFGATQRVPCVNVEGGGRWSPPQKPMTAADMELLRNQYATSLRNSIRNAWVKPPSAMAGVDCLVQITQVAGGEVTGAHVTQCNGDEAVRQSIEDAVYRASPLPSPFDQAAFEKNLNLRFNPDE